MRPPHPCLAPRLLPCLQVLLEAMVDLARAYEYAAKTDEAPVWSELAHSQLSHGKVADAMASYLRAGDSSKYIEVGQRGGGGQGGRGTPP